MEDRGTLNAATSVLIPAAAQTPTYLPDFQRGQQPHMAQGPAMLVGASAGFSTREGGASRGAQPAFGGVPSGSGGSTRRRVQYWA